MHKRIEREIVGGPQPFANYGVPCYGERGRLSFVGTKKVQCHVCGKYFQFLGLHVVKTHEMTCDHYRESFGLPHDTGLVCIALHERFGNVHGPRLATLKDYARARSREAISQLEHDDSWVAKRAAKASAKQGGRAWLVRDCVICGREYRCLSNSPRLTCEGNGSACDSERRRRNATGKGHSEESKAAMRAAKLKPALHFD